MRRKAWCAAALTSGGVIAAALWLVVPLAVGGGTKSTRAEATEPCQLVQPQPEHPLEANTVAVDALFKTVVMEKETFACSAEPTLPPTQLRDVETFIEIVEASTPNGVKVVDKRVESATCIKGRAPGGWVVRCSTAPIDLVPVESLTISGGCVPSQEQPTDPVEMNTAVGEKGRVKTVTVEKELFTCGGVVVDVYLFTEIIEAPSKSTAGATIRPIAKQFEGIVCFKNVQNAKLISCESGPMS
jgi:hypothetical protein